MEDDDNLREIQLQKGKEKKYRARRRRVRKEEEWYHLLLYKQKFDNRVTIGCASSTGAPLEAAQY